MMRKALLIVDEKVISSLLNGGVNDWNNSAEYLERKIIAI
jgi:hypothetical protein